ncbi:septal ring lytic transglycosylase RlpA family protein [Dysgonomonas sp. Marseille-P4677]|uniref:septal ring lytic transglycosylase RlpA family protein n=1 Tax=Dysgonomonas sp. Marseille-P4677 TaxID=2364790 RepID=UPI001F31AEC3|nr:septal ring lytic transglycosylase RlpA family protein [Dysgonomonas sp. Marseille-P4677]
MSKAQDIGYATFYGAKFNNRKTASGEIYRKDSLVCAHKTFPFGTILKIKNLENDKEVIVRVIDRGPFRKKFVIDLSYAAAKQLEMVRKGVVKVAISEQKTEILPFLPADTVFSLK